jgi:hypothetical protein
MALTYTIVDSIPNCDFGDLGNARAEFHNNADSVPARYDGATYDMGRWANMCEPHFTAIGVGLGTGRGQKLILRDSDEHKAMLRERAALPKPSVESLLAAAVMGDLVETGDGCEIEADGTCPHGQNSPLLDLGLI